MDLKRDPLRGLVSWAFYDFANTIFSATVLTAYFPLYFTERTPTHWHLGAATTSSMLAAGVLLPLLGALTDRTGKTKTYLIRTTLVCILALLALSVVTSPFFLILFFTISCFFYHASLVFYNSLLPVIAVPARQGFASGLGTGLGYLGVVFSLPLAHGVDQNWGRPLVFSVAGLLFFLFSLPLFLWVPERRVPKPEVFRWQVLTLEWKKIFGLIRKLPERPALALFLSGNFLVVDAVNATIFWFLVYAREVFQPGQSNLVWLLLSVNASAFAAGCILGWATDRFGAMRILLVSSFSLVATLAGMAATNDFLSFALLSLTGGALAIAGIWTSGRKVLVDLSPQEYIGEYFGLYGLTTKISVISNLIFSVLADSLGFRPALFTLVLPALVGTALLFLSGSIRVKRNGSSEGV